MSKLKRFEEGQEIPYDFWNYLINPITGYYIEPKDKYKKEDQYRYHKTTSFANHQKR